MSSEAVNRPSYAYARRHGVLVVGMDDDGKAHVVVRTPGDLAAINEIRRHLDQPLRLEKVAAERFGELLERYYSHGEDSARQAAADLGGDSDLLRLAEDLPEPEDLLALEDDAPIIRLLNALLSQAVKEGASDIHIEPYEQHVAIRFRVDGVMREVMTPNRALAPLLASRVKVMARLDIAEKRLPQDGRISLRIAGRPVDVRVSTLPSGHGERVVLRLLDQQSGRLDLGELGMDPATREGVDQLIQRPHGILLVTGPTGSGKTTSLYAMLSRLNDRTRNIMTVEDPVEYDLPGIAQTQVNSKVELTFARGLRAILRQDPDVVMVGEIRDRETAEIAVQASLTGHLVLSTLHTNSAVGAITRLIDMGVEPFLLSSSLIGVLAQRLVRRLDEDWREQWTISNDEMNALKIRELNPMTLYRPREDLPQGVSGYRGRCGIYELVPITNDMRRLIHERASEAELERLARQHTPSLFADGWAKAKAGITSLEEVMRITRDH
ncbi:MAG: GspE family T2SS ATPase variant XcpR [Wenzhouxiangellaceae bacterium]